jgi:hypothetical protein
VKYMAMPQLNITISSELDEKVRKKAGRLYGASKDSISVAVKEALNDWLAKPEPAL